MEPWKIRRKYPEWNLAQSNSILLSIHEHVANCSKTLCVLKPLGLVYKLAELKQFVPSLPHSTDNKTIHL